jgi:3-hydroxyacyl-CoA dehydrogenase
MGRPKSATFRTCDVVGLDTLVHVAKGVADNCADDERREVFEIPDYVQHLVDNDRLGSKSGAGFYKKVKNEQGKSEILVLDLQTLEYRSKNKVKFSTLDAAKAVDSVADRTRLLFNGTDEAGDFYRRIFADVFAYVAKRVPEIANEPYRIDDALRAGFGWELGAFESWDAIGFEAGCEAIKTKGLSLPDWVEHFAQKKATARSIKTATAFGNAGILKNISTSLSLDKKTELPSAGFPSHQLSGQMPELPFKIWAMGFSISHSTPK